MCAWDLEPAALEEESRCCHTQCVHVFTLPPSPSPFTVCRPTSRAKRTSHRRWPFPWTPTQRRPSWRAILTTLVHTHTRYSVRGELAMCARELHRVDLSYPPSYAASCLPVVYVHVPKYVCFSLGPVNSLCYTPVSPLMQLCLRA